MMFRKRAKPGDPLYGYEGPDPETVCVCMPIADFKPHIECVSGMQMCAPFFKRPIYFAGDSEVNKARDRVAHKWIEKTDFTWAVWLDSDIGFTPQDWVYLMEGDDPLVVGPYSKKSLEGIPVTSGFGFTRVHRKVFEAIRGLLDEEGRERVARFFLEGDVHVDYFPNGPDGFGGNWISEDNGFFTWARIAGFEPRLEHRVDLTHYGRHGFKLPRAQV